MRLAEYLRVVTAPPVFRSDSARLPPPRFAIVSYLPLVSSANVLRNRKRRRPKSSPRHKRTALSLGAHSLTGLTSSKRGGTKSQGSTSFRAQRNHQPRAGEAADEPGYQHQWSWKLACRARQLCRPAPGCILLRLRRLCAVPSARFSSQCMMSPDEETSGIRCARQVCGA